MHKKKILTALAVAVAALESMVISAAADSTPEAYRAILVVAQPLSPTTALMGGIGVVEATEYEVMPGIYNGSNESVMGVPFGFQHAINENLELQGYVLLSNEFNREIILGDEELDQPNEIEIRPALGLTAMTDIFPNVEIGGLVRYEARFKDVTEDYVFENRFRLRPYIDFTFAKDEQAGTSWHFKFEIDNKFVIGEDDTGSDYSYFNGIMLRPILGYSFSKSLSVDLKYSHEWSRSEPGADWEDSNDTFTVHFVKMLSTSEGWTAKKVIEFQD